LQHLQKTIRALQQNALATQSELFIFSDAPKSGDEERVASVRKYLRTVDGFKEVHVVERMENGRVANGRGGVRMLLDQFGKVIFLEEDIISAPGFLTFMNQALDKYESNDRIFSITGYCPPIVMPADYREDVFFLRRFTAWGFGTWKDRFDRLEYLTPSEYERFATNKKRVKEFVSAGGADMMAMLKLDAYGKIDAGDVKAMYAQFLSNQYTVYPTKSLTFNTGHDGTGTHCGKNKKFYVKLSNKLNFILPDQVVIDRRIVKAYLKFRNNLYKPRLHTRIQAKLKKVVSMGRLRLR